MSGEMELNNVINNNTNIKCESGPVCSNIINDKLYNISCDNREDDDNISGYSIPPNSPSTSKSHSVSIYRYKFLPEITDELYKFSKIHQYDHRKDFKEAWETWVQNNDEMIDCEIRRLVNLGYDGDVKDKMFKSARYYFRKKSTEKKKPADRRVYVSVSKTLLDAIDAHVKENASKPSEGFENFYKEHGDIVREEETLLSNAGYTDQEAIMAKIKKTYKNRCFLNK